MILLSLVVWLKFDHNYMDIQMFKGTNGCISGGTAGNVVAGRLAENPTVSILVIEAGSGYAD